MLWCYCRPYAEPFFRYEPSFYLIILRVRLREDPLPGLCPSLGAVVAIQANADCCVCATQYASSRVAAVLYAIGFFLSL